MKKYIYIAASLLLTITMQAQDRPQPKPGPAPKINLKKPESFTLKNGLKVLVVENSKLPRVSFSLTLDNSPYAEGDKKGVSDLLSAMIGNASLTKSKEQFNKEIDFIGADVNFYSSGAVASGLSKYSAKLLEFMADGTLNPLFTQEDFDAEKNKLIEGLKAEEKNVTAISGRVNNVLSYGKTHYKGEFTSENTIKNITLQDVVNNYKKYFVPANAYLVVVGDVKTKEVKAKVEQLFGAWKTELLTSVSYSNPIDLQYSQINFIDMPNAVQSEITLSNLSNLKYTDKDYFAALMANQILGGGGEGRLFLNLREKHGWTYGSYANLGAGKYINRFSSSASVRNAVTDSAVVEIFNELKRIRTELVSDEDLRNAKAKYIGNFVIQMEKPATIARYALNTKTQGLPDDYYENYVKNINAVTAEDVRNAAKKYFLANNTRVVIVGKAAEVLPALEEMSKKEKLPISYFDKTGEPTTKPEVKKAISAGVTAQTVIQKHIDAIGGQKALSAVKSTVLIASGTVQGMNLSFTDKKTVGKSAMSIASGPMEMGGSKFNGTKGFNAQQGQKKEMTADEIANEKNNAFPFVELELLKNKDVKLKGIEQINGADAYAVTLVNTTYFYDVKTGFKVAKSVAMGQGDKKRETVTNYDDYKDVKGIKFPYKTTLNVGIAIELITSEVKINDGVTDKDFE